MKFRLYPSKDASIIEGKRTNTGKNQVGEIWYGRNGIARHLIKFDESKWVEKVASGHVTGNLEDVSCTLNLFNCFPIFEGIFVENERSAQSADIEVMEMTSFWDEGVGHSFVGLTEDGFCNWYSATSNEAWLSHGGDFSFPELFTYHVDRGNENIVGDVTDAFTGWVADENYGVMIKFTDDYEDRSGDTKTIFKFHNKETNTYLLPYVEINWDGQIRDGRNEVIHGTTKRLYFYAKRSGAFTDIEDIDSVEVDMLDYSGGVIDTLEFTGDSIVKQYPGIYHVSYPCPVKPDPEETYTFRDTWSVQLEEGASYIDIVQDGECLPTSSVWNVSQSSVTDKKVYRLDIPNIKNEYKLGDILFLPVRATREYTNIVDVMTMLEYRVILVDGTKEFTMVNWEDLSYTNEENLLILDTSWFIQNNLYKIEFRNKSNAFSNTIVEQSLSRYFWVR
jgi:hypothetical protein